MKATKNPTARGAGDARSGANALRGLLVAIRDATETQFDGTEDANGNFDERLDPRDYVGFCKLIEESLRTDFVEAGAAHREGYLRAVADLFSRVADDVGPPDLDTWDPLESSEPAMAAQRSARAGT